MALEEEVRLCVLHTEDSTDYWECGPYESKDATRGHAFDGFCRLDAIVVTRSQAEVGVLRLMGDLLRTDQR